MELRIYKPSHANCPFNVDLLQLDMRLINHLRKTGATGGSCWRKKLLSISGYSLNYLLWEKLVLSPYFLRPKTDPEFFSDSANQFYTQQIMFSFIIKEPQF